MSTSSCTSTPDQEAATHVARPFGFGRLQKTDECYTTGHPAILEGQLVRQEAIFLQQIEFELATLTSSVWMETCCLWCALLGSLGPRSAVTDSVGRLANRLAAIHVDSFPVQSCVRGQQCGHLCLVRVVLWHTSPKLRNFETCSAFLSTLIRCSTSLTP